MPLKSIEARRKYQKEYQRELRKKHPDKIKKWRRPGYMKELYRTTVDSFDKMAKCK